MVVVAWPLCTVVRTGGVDRILVRLLARSGGGLAGYDLSFWSVGFGDG